MSQEQPKTLGEWAVWYAEHGFGVFPVQAQGKRPATQHGLNDWTDDASYVRDYWIKHPKANIGIACGSPSNGLLVIDLDTGDAKDGMHTLAEWQAAHGELPETAESITGGGGRHLLYRTDRTNIHPSTNSELGVDIRCDGSYIVAPPSVHPSGELYEWWASPEDVGIATADGRVYDFVDHVQRNGGQDETKKDNGRFRLPDEIKKGERDNTLFKYAAHLRSIGRSDEEIMAAVAGVNSMRCNPPMDSKDVERIVKSACRYDRGDDGGASSDRAIGAPGGGGGKPSISLGDVFDGHHNVKHNMLGKLIMKNNLARFIDGAPAIWTGRRWEFGKHAFERVVNSYVDEITTSKLNDTVAYIMRNMPETESDNSFDGRYYVQFSNVTYDVLADEAVEPKPEMLIIGSLPVKLNLDAPYGLADEFIESISDGDKDVSAVLCEIIGACMCSSHIVSRSPMLIGRANGGTGKAANGKSTYINWIRAIIGSGNASSLSISDMENRFAPGLVVGKLANLGDDISDGYLKGAPLSTFKKMVTGDEIFADVKNGTPFKFRPLATQVFSMNAMPRMSDTTEGVYRRLTFVPFYAQFKPGMPGFDPIIGRKLAMRENLERGAVLGLMSLRGLIERNDFTAIPAMADEMAKVQAENSSVVRWATENEVTAETLNGVTVAEAYRQYRNWAEDSGEQFPRQKTVFSSELVDFIAGTDGDGTRVEVARKYINGVRTRVYNLVTWDKARPDPSHIVP